MLNNSYVVEIEKLTKCFNIKFSKNSKQTEIISIIDRKNTLLENKYKNAVIAIKDLDLKIKEGKITGLIGPDGSSKTTLIRLIIGLLVPSFGKIKTLNLDPQKDKNEIIKRIGYMPQNFGLYEDLTVLENLELFSILKNINKKQIKSTIEKLLKFTDLANFKNRLAGKLSGGMKQKLGLACTLMGDPQFLLLDEPSVGVDPISRRELIDMVNTLCKEGISILWSTSYLDEAENFDDVILLNEGRLLFQGKPSDLTDRMKNRVFSTSIETLNNIENLTNKENKTINNRYLLESLVSKREFLTDATIEGDKIRIVLKKGIIPIETGLILNPIPPRFEDSVIDILGGNPPSESKLAKFINIKENNILYPIEADNLVKKYGNFYAVKNNSFKVKKGEIFGLLGPNGAGKSTSFKMMCSLITPTSGVAKIMGIDISKNPSLARSYIGYMAQKFSLYKNLDVYQNLQFYSMVYGLDFFKRNNRIKEMIEIFQLEKYLKTNTGDLPLGYKQRLALACSTMHNPDILFLDEPTSGVDPLTRRDFWNHINSLAQKGVTIMVTTHFMDEAQYCDRISLFYKGESIAIGSPSELKHKVSKNATMEETFIKLIKEYEMK